MTDKGKSMAKTSETPRKKRKAGEMAMWLLMAMLVLGLGGFGIENFSGGGSSVAKVAGRQISADDYARQMQQQLNNMSQQFGQSINMEQARAMGLDRQVLIGLIDLTAQDAEADRLGLSVGDAVVASAITEMNAFKGVNGKFDRETYGALLRQRNMSEPRFESQLRDDMARQLLTGAIRGGFSSPAALTTHFQAWMGEHRDVSVLRLNEADLETQIAPPSDADLQAWYQAHISQFTRPEAKTIAYAVIAPADLEAKVSLDEAALRAAYEQNIDHYVQPERRLVERLVFPDEASAKAASERIAAGGDFADEVRTRGLSLDDIDLGDVSRTDLGPAGDAVFALSEPGVTGVSQSSLGPAIFRVNAVLPAQETAFEAARAELEADQRAIAARKEIDAKVNTVEDSLAGGATIEDLAREQGMRNGRFDYAAGADDNDPISASATFQSAIAAAHEGDFPEALRLEDGSLVAFEVRGSVAASPRPFDSVSEKVATAWHAEALSKALRAHAETIEAAVAAGTPLESFGAVQVIHDLAREGTIDGAPNMAMRDLFKMAEGEVKLVQDADYSVILRVDRIIAAPNTGTEAEDLKAQIENQIEQTLADDAVSLWTNALSQDAGISIDQARIDAINAQMN